MHEPGARDAYILKHALRGTVKDHKAVTEMICFRTPSQIGQLKRAYFTNVGTNLEDDIESEASGHHKKVFSLSSLYNILFLLGSGCQGEITSTVSSYQCKSITFLVQISCMC